MIEKNFKKYLLILILILVLVSIICITLGSVKIDTNIIFKAFTNKLFGREIYQKTWENNLESIIFNLRLPRIFLAIISGSVLSFVGVLMQTLTRNSLSDPYILGISSGASTGATISIVLGLFSFLGSFGITVGAFLGAMLSALMVFNISGVTKRYLKNRLILTGVAVSFIFTAITNFVIVYAKNDSLVKNAVFWSMGSLAGANYNQVKFSAVALIISFLLTTIFYKDLDALLLGEVMARNLGVNTKILIRYILVISTLLTGIIVAFTGVIGFVGLIVPHIARQFIGAKHKRLIPLSMIIGAILMVVTDTIARTVLSPEEIPIGIVTALLGAPFFLYLISLNNYDFGGNK